MSRSECRSGFKSETKMRESERREERSRRRWGHKERNVIVLQDVMLIHSGLAVFSPSGHWLARSFVRLPSFVT